MANRKYSAYHTRVISGVQWLYKVLIPPACVNTGIFLIRNRISHNKFPTGDLNIKFNTLRKILAQEALKVHDPYRTLEMVCRTQLHLCLDFKSNTMWISGSLCRTNHLLFTCITKRIKPKVKQSLRRRGERLLIVSKPYGFSSVGGNLKNFF